MPQTGISRLAVVKLNRSNTVMPKIFQSAAAPNDSAQSEPKTMAMTVLSIEAFSRVIFHSSQKKEMEISLMEMVDVIDARKSRKKKAVAHICPPGVCEKM